MGRRSELPERSDIVVVGAGILGLAAARQLARRRPGRMITVLGKEPETCCRHVARNSGVIPAAI